SEVPAEPTEEIERIHLAVVPLPDQPEVPIPSPTASSPPAIALVRSEAVMAEVAFVETPPAPVGDCVNEPELTRGTGERRQGCFARRSAVIDPGAE
ncbi:MAG: hypothetical protein WA694_11035, partial [Pseudolabrys sp.]